jgi:hypothetical protein
MEMFEVYGYKDGLYSHLDTVFFLKGYSTEKVRESLIQRDGFDENIEVVYAYAGASSN